MRFVEFNKKDKMKVEWCYVSNYFHEEKYFLSWKKIFFFMKINLSCRENNLEVELFSYCRTSCEDGRKV